MHAVGIHSAMAIKRQRKRRDEQKRARERRYSTQSSESGETFHSPSGSMRRKYHSNRGAAKPKTGMLESQVVTSIGMLHIGIVFIVFGLFLCGAGIIPDETMTWSVFTSTTAWWNEVTCTGLFSFGLGLFLLILNCLISRKEEADLEDYVQRQLTRSRSGHRLERDIETGILTTRHTRKAVALQKSPNGGHNGIATTANAADLVLMNNSSGVPGSLSVAGVGVGVAGDDLGNGGVVSLTADMNCLNASGDILLESIIEEENVFLNDRSAGISPIEIENDTKQLLRSDSINDTINMSRI